MILKIFLQEKEIKLSTLSGISALHLNIIVDHNIDPQRSEPCDHLFFIYLRAILPVTKSFHSICRYIFLNMHCA
jgi:hypothetical protein